MIRAIYFFILLLSSISVCAQIEPNVKVEEPILPVRSVVEAEVSYNLEETVIEKAIPQKEGKLIIEKDANIDLLIQDYIDNKKFMGYRIQLFAGSSKLDALKVKSDFLAKYQKNYPEVIYQVPNFKVRVGNFRGRLEATQMLQTYKTDFPYAFIVQDEIKLEPNSK